MTVQTFYRLAVWLPLLVPAAIAVAVHGFHMSATSAPAVKLVQLLLASGIYGGIPYALLAAYATWWIDGRPEPVIQRRALLAPVMMSMAWVPLAAAVGVLYGRLDTFVGLAGLGIFVIIPLGYSYVAVVFLLRASLGRISWLSDAPASR